MRACPQERRKSVKPDQRGTLETPTDILKDFRERNKKARELAGSDEAFLDMHTKRIEQNAASQKPAQAGPQGDCAGNIDNIATS